ncbi:multiple epidermal growth factor-like domains 11 [Elysia marginata]|uniref:Multiple epidermal growth factor-like domains 11 n=1 Tax=Elysia marginata TaxID=1093978 RepID=A0AAV4FR13_9GAST|nr:multiple epidermal growth factor-like domains 11 [Elysia marginata]
MAHNFFIFLSLKLTSSYCFTRTECDEESYGPECSRECSSNCRRPGSEVTSRTCDLMTGACLHGCQGERVGDQCQYECLEGTYGEGCRETCSPDCVDKKCNAENGTCVHGIIDGVKTTPISGTRKYPQLIITTTTKAAATKTTKITTNTSNLFTISNK